MTNSPRQQLFLGHSARSSLRHTEDKSITSYKKACQSISCRLQYSMDQGNLMEKEWSIDQGNLMSVTARTHRLGLYLRSKDRQLLRNIAKKSVITNSKQLKPKKSADSYKDNYVNRNWNFVKLTNKILQRWKNYGNSRVLPSIRSRNESSSKTRTLFWNYQAEYKNYKMK